LGATSRNPQSPPHPPLSRRGERRRVAAMKPTLIALLILGVCLPLAGADKKTDGKMRAGAVRLPSTGHFPSGTNIFLIGGVKSVKVWEFKIEEKFGKPVRTGGMKTTMKYDEKGNSVERVRYTTKGEISSKTAYKYDEKGNKTESVWYDGGGGIRDKLTFKYDKKGNMVEVVSYDESTIVGKTIFKYDGKGNRLQLTKSGEIVGKTAYKYDKKGNKVGSGFLYSNGKYQSVLTYKYDEKGNMVETVFYDTYARNGRPYVRIGENPKRFKRTYKYDEKGNSVNMTIHKPITGFGETRFVPTDEQTWEFTCWD
jgi:hypothetical protein